MADPNFPQSHPIKFRNVFRGTGGPQVVINEVIDDADELKEYADSCKTDGDNIRNQQVDFKKERLIAVAIGERPTSGFEVEIVAVTQVTGGFVGLQTIVSYVERAPRGPAGQMLTYPHHIVRAKNVMGVVIYRRISEGTPVFPGAPQTFAAPAAAPADFTTLAVGEEDPPITTLAVGEEEPRLTTMRAGEEGPTLFRPGEHGTTVWSPWEENLTTMRFGEEGVPSDPRLEDPFGSSGGGGGPFGGF